MAAVTPGIVEVLDRDGQVRQTLVVSAWPLRVGRALDNDLVLSDPHVAGHHLLLRAAAGGIDITAADTRNGVQVGPRRLRHGEPTHVAPRGDAVELIAGRTRLRVRLADFALAPEMPLAAQATTPRRLAPLGLAAGALLAALLFNAWLQNDPDTLGRAVGATLLSALSATAIWCGAWALLSKTFTRQAHFGWHLRVFVLTALALIVVDTVPSALAFALSWPAASDFAFVALFLVGGAGFYFHLLAVEPARHRLMKWVAATGAAAGIALTLWFNLQRTDRFGDELYMYHLFPPALRLARPVPTDDFIGGLARLKPVLDKKSRDPGRGGGDGVDDEEPP